MKNLEEYLHKQSKLIEDRLSQLIPDESGYFSSLYEAARYAILGGGKRLRPILALATTQVLGGDLSFALSSACTLEIIHTYSLIHDDLPCMDNDDYRRGKLTVHKKYNEAHAVLTGDFLLTRAFEILATDNSLSVEIKNQLMATLAHRSGAHGLIGGQVMDIIYSGKTITLENLQLIHQNKTGALITASIEFGGIISRATDTQMHYLRKFGEYAGLAFQVVDDILDVTASEAKHGKKIASDVLNDKCTYVTLLGVEQAKNYAFDLYQKAVAILKYLPDEEGLLASLSNYVINRKN